MNESNEEDDKYQRFLNAQKAAFGEPQNEKKNITQTAAMVSNEPA